MNQITVENFRCFRVEQHARLAPLTLLVGENSTGKTSFLALIRALWDAAYRRDIPDFKEAPYDLGSFDEIAHYRGGRGGRAKEFKAGFRALRGRANRRVHTASSRGSSHRFEVTFSRLGTAPVPTSVLLEHDGVVFTHQVSHDLSRETRLRTSAGEWLWQTSPTRGARFAPDDALIPRFVNAHWFMEHRDAKPVGKSPKPTPDDTTRLGQLLRQFDRFVPRQRPFASAPVRSKPRRTYDPARPSRDPEGRRFRCTSPPLFSRTRDPGRH